MSLPKLRSATRLAILVALGLLLLIPLSMVRSLVFERQGRSQEVTQEIASKWGGTQTIQPPILSLPWTKEVVHKDGEVQVLETWVRLFPETLSIDGDLQTQTRKRGLFEVPVYTATLEFEGAWNTSLAGDGPGPGWTPHWERAVVSVDPGDARSLSRAPLATAQGAPLALSATRPEGGVDNFRLHAPLHLAVSGASLVPFHLQIVQRGSQSLALAPASGTTHVRIRSDWASPSFQGSFLPEESSIGNTGFDASWSVSSLNLDVPMVWRDQSAPPTVSLPSASSDYAFVSKDGTGELATLAVSLIEPVDSYDSIERSLKYGALVIALAFLALFLFEAFLDQALHPVQYGLIGLALTFFYLLLLSVSEHFGFDTAYALASALVTGLVAGYASAVLAGWARGLSLGGGLVGLWSFLYTLLKAEDWSLLMGSTGLFVLLVAVMWLTRRIDWNRRDTLEAPDA